MILITVAILITLLTMSILKEKNIYNPLSIFLSIWLIICALASLRLFGMYDYSYRAPLVIIIGVIGYSIGYIFGKKYNIANNLQIPVIGLYKNKKYKLRKNFYIMLLIICLFVYISMGLSIVSLLLEGYDPSIIREMYRYGGETDISGTAIDFIYGSILLKHLDNYLAKPISIISIPLMTIDILKNEKVTLLSILSICVICLSMLVNFGRATMLVFVVTFVSGYWIRKKTLTDKGKKRIGIVILIFAVLTIALLGYLTIMRLSGSNSNFIQNLYAYFAIPVPLLDFWMEYAERNEDFSLGTSFIMGMIANFMNLISKFGLESEFYNIAMEYNYNLVDRFVPVFPNYSYNAYVSMFFAFFLDFREPGVFLGSFILGLIISKFYKNSECNDAFFVYYLFLLQVLLLSFVRWQFVIVAYFFAAILLRLTLIETQNE